jgi:addiction module HigA family antidote
MRSPLTRIEGILRTGKPHAVSADAAIRVASCLGTSPEFWLNLQSAYHLSRTLAQHAPAIDRDAHLGEEWAA